MNNTRKVFYTEQELITFLKANDREAFEYLYAKYANGLYGIILKIVKNEDNAADVMQESFLKIWRNIGMYQKEKGTLFTWMLNVARNTAIDRYRQDTRSEVVVNIEHVAEIEVSHPMFHHSDMENKDLIFIVSRLLPERKVLIEMVYLMGYTHEETAKMLMLPLGTIKSRIRKALQDLRELLILEEARAQFA